MGFMISLGEVAFIGKFMCKALRSMNRAVALRSETGCSCSSICINIGVFVCQRTPSGHGFSNLRAMILLILSFKVLLMIPHMIL